MSKHSVEQFRHSGHGDAAGDFLPAGASGAPAPVALDAGGDGPLTAAVPTDEMDIGGGASHRAQAEDRLLVDRTTLALSAADYYAEATKKDLIVLHFTAGQSARSAVTAWRSTPEHVATAYVVDVDGTVYETFRPDYWAYHLGIRGGTEHERRSIGVEIANVGPLQPARDDAEVLAWWPRDWGQKYCTLAETDRYCQREYRGKRYFATFPDAQLDAVGRLVRDLCDRFEIARCLPDASRRLECDPTFAAYKGVATHANFRADKWDVGPAFDWEQLGF